MKNVQSQMATKNLPNSSLPPKKPLSSTADDDGDTDENGFPIVLRTPEDAVALADRARRTEKGPTTLQAVKKLASDALHLGEFVASIVNAERKFLDTNYGPAQVANNGWSASNQPIWVSSVQVGTGPNQRTGMSIKAESIDVRLHAYMSDSNSTPTRMTQAIRCILFMDRMFDAAYPTIFSSGAGDNRSLLDAGGSSTSSDGIIAWNNPDCQGRYWILFDKVLTLDWGSYSQKMFDFHHTFKNHHILWDTEVAGTITTVNSGHLYFAAFAYNSSAFGSSQVYDPYLNMWCKLRYYDN